MKTDPQVTFGKTVVAVELGGEWFKLVQITREHGTYSLDKVVLKPASEVESLAGPDFLKAIGVPEVAGLPVVACLPRQLVNVRLFDLPSRDPQEIADMVDLQLARQTPYSRDEIVFDYRLFDSDKSGYTRVMLVIVQSSVIRPRFALLEQCGFQVAWVTVSTDAWMAAQQADALQWPAVPAGAVALVDLDGTSCDFAVMQQGVPLFDRTLSLERGQFADPASVASLVTEIGQALETFRNETPAVPVGAVVLAGAAARWPALMAAMKETLHVEVVATTGLERKADEHVVSVEHKSVSLAGVVGAALATGLQVNLVPESVQMRKLVMLRARQLTGTGILLLAIVALLSMILIARNRKQEMYLDELRSTLDKIAPEVKKIESMQRKIAVVSTRIETRMMPVKVVSELCGLVGDSTVLTAVELVEGGKIVCRGTTETVADTVKLVNAMEDSPVFRNVKSARTTSGKDRTEFEITAEVERKGPQ